jgi:transposase InsO family protein/transposase-like protein
MAKVTWEARRQRAVERLLQGEAFTVICRSERVSRGWLYKWWVRHTRNTATWFQDDSRQPHTQAGRTPAEIEEIVQLVRLEGYNPAQFCGAQAIRWRLEDLAVHPLPALRTIGRILARHALTHRRTGRYEPKGVPYPRLEAVRPNDVHQSDFVGPCYLQGGLRFHSLHSLDMTTRRCGVEPLVVGKADVVPGLWALWRRLGIPKVEQVDNELCFYGSPAHPRGMGKLIRLCLWQGVEPVFIPVREPWRNGAVETFNGHWEAKFQRRVDMTAAADLTRESLAFETRHNLTWRDSALAGKTPMQALAATEATLRFPPSAAPPQEPLPKPERGRSHVIRFIRSTCEMDVFGERFPVPREAMYAYVWGTIDVREQSLSLYLGEDLLSQQEYRLR